MEQIQVNKEFNKNGVHYKIIDRSEGYYLAEVSSIDTGTIHTIEVGRIMIGQPNEFMGKVEAFEYIVGNEAFGSDALGIEGAFNCGNDKGRMAFERCKNGIKPTPDKSYST